MLAGTGANVFLSGLLEKRRGLMANNLPETGGFCQYFVHCAQPCKLYHVLCSGILIFDRELDFAYEPARGLVRFLLSDSPLQALCQCIDRVMTIGT